MKRKVNRVGTSTLTVSLPSKWTRKHGIGAGSELEVYEEDQALRICCFQEPKTLVSVRVNIEDMNVLLLNRILSELYVRGVEELALVYESQKIISYKSGEKIDVLTYVFSVIQRFIGWEIVSQSNKKIIIQNLFPSSESSRFDVVEWRIYFLIADSFADFCEVMEKNHSILEKRAKEYHENLTKFIYYCRRLLKFSNLDEVKKSRLTAFYERLDMVLDSMRHAAEYFSELVQPSKNLKQAVKDIFDIYLIFFKLKSMNFKQLGEVNSIVKKRYDLISFINKNEWTLDEYKVVAECKNLLNMISPFLELFVVLNMDEFIQK